MKVLHVIPSFYPARAYGGPIESGYALSKRLAAVGTEVCVLTTDADGLERTLDVEKKKEIELAPNLRVRYCKRWFRHSVSPALLILLPKYIAWADVVHLTAVYSFPTIPTLFLCRCLGRPVVWSPRGALQRWEGSRRIFLKKMWEHVCCWVLPKRMLIHVTSEEEKSASQSRIKGIETMVIPNGVEIRREPRRSSDGGVLRLGYLGRIHPIKGIENLLDACANLSIASCAWKLMIAGSGEATYEKRIRERVHSLGLSGRVEFLGDVRGEVKERFFEQVDVLVVPSYTENFGMVVAEALANGVPVIASKGTPWRRLEELGCGLWVKNDPGVLANALKRIAEMPFEEMGRRGKEWMQKEYDWAQVAKQMSQLYEEAHR